MTANNNHTGKSASAPPSNTHFDTFHAQTTASAEQHTSLTATRVPYVCDLVYTYKIVNGMFSHFFVSRSWLGSVPDRPI